MSRMALALLVSERSNWRVYFTHRSHALYRVLKGFQGPATMHAAYPYGGVTPSPELRRELRKNFAISSKNPMVNAAWIPYSAMPAAATYWAVVIRLEHPESNKRS